MCLGAVSCRGAGLQASIETRERPNLTKLLIRYVKDRHRASQYADTEVDAGSAVYDEDFTFTSIQVPRGVNSLQLMVLS